MRKVDMLQESPDPPLFNNTEFALRYARAKGFPVTLRGAYTLIGNDVTVEDEDEFQRNCDRLLRLSPTEEVEVIKTPASP